MQPARLPVPPQLFGPSWPSNSFPRSTIREILRLPGELRPLALHSFHSLAASQYSHGLTGAEVLSSGRSSTCGILRNAKRPEDGVSFTRAPVGMRKPRLRSRYQQHAYPWRAAIVRTLVRLLTVLQADESRNLHAIMPGWLVLGKQHPRRQSGRDKSTSLNLRKNLHRYNPCGHCQRSRAQASIHDLHVPPTHLASEKMRVFYLEA
jgi:hypothetical protein